MDTRRLTRALVEARALADGEAVDACRLLLREVNDFLNSVAADKPAGPAIEANRERAAMALTSLHAFPDFDERDPATSIVDLIGDLMHLADVLEPPQPASYGGLQAVEAAQRHYLAEFHGVD